MSRFFAARNSVQVLNGKKAAKDFDEDWLKRWMGTWTSAFHQESWEPIDAKNAFPFAEPMGLIPESQEGRAMSFERYQT